MEAQLGIVFTFRGLWNKQYRKTEKILFSYCSHFCAKTVFKDIILIVSWEVGCFKKNFSKTVSGNNSPNKAVLQKMERKKNETDNQNFQLSLFRTACIFFMFSETNTMLRKHIRKLVWWIVSGNWFWEVKIGNNPEYFLSFSLLFVSKPHKQWEQNENNFKPRKHTFYIVFILWENSFRKYETIFLAFFENCVTFHIPKTVSRNQTNFYVFQKTKALRKQKKKTISNILAAWCNQ